MSSNDFRTDSTADWQQRREDNGFAAPEILPPVSAEEPARPHDWTYRPAPPPPAPAPRRQPLLRWSAAPATYLLVFANVLVFLLMMGTGAQPLSLAGAPSPDALMLWGAKSSTSVLINHEWWRLVTAMFIHAGVLHLATNMWCLWNLGLLGEPMIGPLGMAAVYLLSGVAGNLMGLGVDALMSTVDGTPLSMIPSVGASGAVFGIAGLLIIYLKRARLPIPEFELKRLRRSVMYFAGINFVLGAGISLAPTEMKVDNMAHLGGFLMGLGLGVPLAPEFGTGRARYFRRQTVVFATSTVLLAAVCFGVAMFWSGS
jgi:rhomboid protease GluP